MQTQARYELSELEQIITNSKFDGETSAPLLAVQLELDRVRHGLMLQSLSIQNDIQLQRYIYYHQHALVSLINRVYNEIIDCRNNGHSTKELETIQQALLDAITFLEVNFIDSFNDEGTLPEPIMVTTRLAISNFIDFILVMEKQSSIAPVIKSIIEELQVTQTATLTFHDNKYLNILIAEIRGVFLSTPSITVVQLLNSLYYFNFNTDQIANHAKFRIQSIIESLDDRADIINWLAYELKEINQIHTRQDMHYLWHAPSLQQQVVRYIEEEIRYHERCIRLATSISVTPQRVVTNKISINTSVAQVAYLLRLLVETNIIDNNNVTHMLQFVATHIATKKSGMVSQGSLRSKYYSPERGTQYSVKIILQELLKAVDIHLKN